MQRISSANTTASCTWLQQCHSRASGVRAYLEICALEADLPIKILDKGVVDVAPEHIRIPSAKERRLAQQGVCLFPETQTCENRNMTLGCECVPHRLGQTLRRPSAPMRYCRTRPCRAYDL
jgi:uncharacterized protein (UPF0179 family)